MTRVKPAIVSQEVEMRWGQDFDGSLEQFIASKPNLIFGDVFNAVDRGTLFRIRSGLDGLRYEVRELTAQLRRQHVAATTQKRDDPSDGMLQVLLGPPPQSDLCPESCITTLDLSIRSRKTCRRLAINTIGELAAKSADELLDTKNFGMASLDEVRRKLAVVGLKLRGE